MNSVSAAASTDSSAGKLPAAKKIASSSVYPAESDSDQVVFVSAENCAEAPASTTVVIIKAEVCEESSSAALTNNQNGGAGTAVPGKGALNAVEVFGRSEIGPVDSDPKTAPNGANQNRMIRVR